jgi:selenium metabolism protein YedF
MQEKELDCQGLACPRPVLQCKEAIEASRPNRLRVIVDNDAAKENVSRFLSSRGYSVLSTEERNGHYLMVAERRGEPSPEAGSQERPEAETELSCVPQHTDQQLVLIASDRIGHGDDELGRRLMGNFLATLPEMGSSLWRIILINSGVKLAVRGSGVLESLHKLKESGVSILVCGTCLSYFQLLEEKQIGETTNMLDVVTSLQLAGKVIKV